METIRGKHSGAIGAHEVAALAHARTGVLLDLGTGDGRFVRHVALADPARLAIGVDACRENLVAASRTAPPNALYVIANALNLPAELRGLASHITINFPWGSLLRGLLESDPDLLQGIGATLEPGGGLELRLNAGALDEEGWAFEQGGDRIQRVLRDAGFTVGSVVPIERKSLRALPSTWAKRLAFGRDPRGLYLCTSAARGRAPPPLLPREWHACGRRRTASAASRAAFGFTLRYMW